MKKNDDDKKYYHWRSLSVQAARRYTKPEQLEHDLHGAFVRAVNAPHDARANDGVAPTPATPRKMRGMAVPTRRRAW